MNNVTKYSVPGLLSGSKNKSYREGILQSSTSLLLFLSKNNLIRESPMDAKGKLKLDFIVRELDLTPAGLELFKKAIPAWLNGLDRGKSPEDISSLDKELTTIKNNEPI